jgi:hypothetical protein
MQPVSRGNLNLESQEQPFAWHFIPAVVGGLSYSDVSEVMTILTVASAGREENLAGGDFIGEHQTDTLVGDTYDHGGGSLRRGTVFPGVQREGHIYHGMEGQRHRAGIHQHSVTTDIDGTALQQA